MTEGNGRPNTQGWNDLSYPGLGTIPSNKLSLLEARLTGTSAAESNVGNAGSSKVLSPNPQRMIAPSSDIGDLEEDDSEEEIETPQQTSNSSGGPSKKRKLFTNQEDETILKMYKAYGPNWDEICKATGVQRSGRQLKNRVQKLTKYPSKPMETSPPPANPALLASSTSTGPPTSSKESLAPKASVQISLPASFQTQAQSITTTQTQTQTQSQSSVQNVVLTQVQPPTQYQPQSTAPQPTATNPSAQLNAEILELQKKVKIYEDKMNEYKRAAEEKERALLEAESRVSQSSQGFDSREKKYTSALRQVLEKVNLRDMKDAREKNAQDNAKIGRLTYERVGHEFTEIWEYGHNHTVLAARQLAITEEQKNLERTRKGLLKKKSSGDLTAQIESMGPPTEPSQLESTDERQIIEQEEIIKLKLLQLKKEEQEIAASLEKIEVEKSLHITETRRIRNEDRSEFKINQIVNGRYMIQCLLGKGGFSEVFKAYDLVECREVSCKIHQLNPHWRDEKKMNYIKHAVRECNIQKSVQHSRIVSLYDVFEINRDAFCTVLEYCEGGDLDRILKTQKVISEREARIITIQIFSGLVYLNQLRKPIIHYDLKPGNILFKNGEVKISDFGLSKIMEENTDMMELTSQGAGTYWYLPPECFEIGSGPPMISSKVDVWSVGVILYQMLFGKKPFGHELSQQRILADQVIVKATGVEFPPKPVVSSECKSFIRRCLTNRKEDRPDVLTIWQDPYLKLKRS